MSDYPTFWLVGNEDEPTCQGIRLILPNGQDVTKFFKVVRAQIDADAEGLNVVTMSFYAKLPSGGTDGQVPGS